jgi:hypothetical protein
MQRRARSDFYVYIKFDHFGTPRYVGKGQGNREYQHERYSSSNRDKDEFIERTWRFLGEVPTIRVHENLTEFLAYTYETVLIEAIGRLNIGTGPLTNLTGGGNGSKSGWHHREEVKKRISASKMGHDTLPHVREALAIANTGRVQSPETCAKRNASLKGKKRSEETCQRMSAAQKRRPKEVRQRAANTRRGKPVKDKSNIVAANLRKAQEVHLGSKRSPEAIANLKEGQRQRFLNETPEQKENRRERTRIAWAKRRAKSLNYSPSEKEA